MSVRWYNHDFSKPFADPKVESLIIDRATQRVEDHETDELRIAFGDPVITIDEAKKIVRQEYIYRGDVETGQLPAYCVIKKLRNGRSIVVHTEAAFVAFETSDIQHAVLKAQHKLGIIDELAWHIANVPPLKPGYKQVEVANAN